MMPTFDAQSSNVDSVMLHAPDADAHHEAAEYALLGLLRGGPAHGYRLAEAFTRRGKLGHILHLKMSLMYAYLRKLDEQGWVSASLEGGTNARTRRVYALTSNGTTALDRWLAQPVGAMRDMRIEFMLKLAFAVEYDKGVATKLVEEQEAAAGRWLGRLRDQAAELPVAERVGALGLVLSHRIRQSEATLAWLEDVRTQLLKGVEHV
jgi:DNA-binding PadR family transcriptional regulator